MPLEFTRRASVDIEVAFAWYEAQRKGMGGHFIASLERVWMLLDAFPDAGTLKGWNVRRILVPRFPYAVYYKVIDGRVVVHACLDMRRDPKVVL
jgi:plasmid stabilization system protein ParE